MAKFPPNLDDGELWIPSDILPGEQNPPSAFTKSSLYNSAIEHARMADLARRYASFSLTHRRRTQTAVIPPRNGSFPAGDLNGSFGFSHGSDGYRVEEQWPVWMNREPNPVHSQVGFRADPVLLNREVGRSSNRVWPLQRSSGTGVFLPRVGAAPTTTAGGRRRQSVRNEQEFEVVGQRSSVADMGKMKKKKKQEECHYHLPPDMGLPQEWTY